MKVCHVTSVHPVYDTRIFHKECSSLAAHGYDVCLLAVNAKDEIVNGIRIIGVSYKDKNRLGRMFIAVNRLYKKAIEINADVYHLHDPELLRIALKLKRKGKIVIFDSHEDVPQQILGKTWLPFVIRKQVSSLYELYEKNILKKIDALVSVTPMLTDRLSGINRNTFQITNFPIYREIVDVRKWSDVIAFAGGISNQWMHENVIKAIENINVKYYLAGRADKKYLEQLKSLKAWKKIEYKGLIPFNQVNEMLQQATIGVALNDYVANVGYKLGTLGNTKLFEYMMAGIPVIATDFTLWKEIIEKYNCGICVNPNDVSSITNAIVYLLEHKLEAKNMGDRGKKAIREEYNWEKQEIILLKLYESLRK